MNRTPEQDYRYRELDLLHQDWLKQTNPYLVKLRRAMMEFHCNKLGITLEQFFESIQEKSSPKAQKAPFLDPNETELIHQCRECNKTFSSFQALCGHQKAHSPKTK